MSIHGVLEDLALADVLQFIHLGGRTGTLFMWQSEERRAEIGFHEGKIVSAWTPGQRRLGHLLTASGLIDEATLAEALEEQRRRDDGQSLGQVLISRGEATRRDIRRVVREQIQDTLFELVTWESGRFHFEVDELHPIDGFGMAPGELLDDLDLNTQMLLLEAARIFDERHRDQEGAQGGETPLGAFDRRLQRAGLGRSGSAEEAAGGSEAWLPAVAALPVLESIRCQVVSRDPELFRALSEELSSELVRVVAVHLREAGNRLPGEGTAPIVVLDLRDEGREVADVATLARTRPSASVVAIVDSAEGALDALRAGAVAAARDGDGSIADCCRNLARVFSHPQPRASFGYGQRGGYSRFRRVVFDVHSGLLSATMALNLMSVISESVERAVLFLVQGDELRAVGAFGFSAGGKPLAPLLRGLRVEPSPESALRRALAAGSPRSTRFREAELPEVLAEVLGPPANDQAVVFPVLGAERAIAVIYTDNGALSEEIEDIQILELATSQVGVAFENEILRQKVEADGLGVILE